MGVPRLAGLWGATKNALKTYAENDLVGSGVQVGLDFGLNMLQGVDPVTSASSALGTGIGSFGGRKLGNLMGPEGSNKRDIARFVGENFGGIAGGTIGAIAPDLIRVGEPVPNPDSAQQDPRVNQMRQMQAQQAMALNAQIQQRQAEQAMAMQGLTPEQLQRMQERAQRRAAEAAYQAQALQQYGQSYGGMY